MSRGSGVVNGTSSPLSSPPPSSILSPCPSDSELSELSTSPSPPPESFDARRRSYPSPSSSQRSSAKTSPAPENMATPPSSNDDCHPRKKRKLADPKSRMAERTTERLDLTKDIPDTDIAQLDRLLKALHKKRKIVVIAGAGISVSAGIPDFRSSGGLFNSLRKEHKLKSSGKDLFDASVYQDDSSTSSFHDMVRSLSQQTKTAQPTAFHHLLATLAHEGRLLRLYSQNVDGIDISLPPLKTQVPLPKKGPWPKTIQLHGGLDHMVCSKCHTLSEFDAEQFNGPVPPACQNCTENDVVRQVAEKRSHGIGRLRPRMVLYNEHNPDDEAIGSCASLDLRTRPDAVIVVGTTLKVPGVRRIAREMCAVVRDRRDGVAIWINNDPEPGGKDLANSWDLIVKGSCDEVARHAAMRKWDEPIVYKEVTDEELIKTKEKQKAAVVVGSPRKPYAVMQVQGQLTPVQSPRISAQQPVKRESIEQPSTPSKTKGNKRKTLDAQLGAFVKMPAKPLTKRRKTQPKKAAGTTGKAKNDGPKITDGFKATKKTVTKFIPYEKGSQETLKATKENRDTINDTIDVKVPALLTPKRGAARVTKIKKEYRDHMAPISSSDPRTNTSPFYTPKRPKVEALTPVKPGTPSWQLLTESNAHQASQISQTSESRPSTGSSQRSEILAPTGSVPRGFKELLCYKKG